MEPRNESKKQRSGVWRFLIDNEERNDIITVYQFLSSRIIQRVRFIHF